MSLSLDNKLSQILTQIREATNLSQKKQLVSLIAVSKTFEDSDIRALYGCGQRDFGESYVGELVAKAEQLKDLNIVWHFIGNLQSNKIKKIANIASYIHSVEKESQVELLSKYRDIRLLDKLNCLIQVNISQLASRHGVRLSEIDSIIRIATAITRTPNLAFRGVMGMSSNPGDYNLINEEFRVLFELYQHLQLNYFSSIDILSMGMSNDFIPAIINGATHVRIGSKIFGDRHYIESTK